VRVEHRHDLATRNPAQGPRRPPQPHIHIVRYVANDFEVSGQVGELERDAHRALDDALAGDEQPQEARERDRKELEAEMA
jgi:hypothetical protein